MPYKHAHWFLLAIFPLAFLAFWPFYLSQFRTASSEFHWHGLTAFAWLVLLTVQSWTIQQGQRRWHRSLGLTSLLLFPLFLAGGAGIFFGMAQRAAAGSEFHVLYAARLTWLDAGSVIMMCWFFHEALRHRRKVRLHSAYLLATVIGLLPPILGRLTAIPLGVTGPGTLDRLYPGFLFAQLCAAAIAMAIGWNRGKDGRPWLIAALLTVAGGLGFATVGGTDWWRDIYSTFAQVPSAPFMAAAGIVGVLISWSGWQAGKRGLPGGMLPAA